MAEECLTGKVIYYRGFLKSCNYRCGYCPFSKTPFSAKQIEQDREALARFYETMLRCTDVGIMFLPYGEALIQPYYLEQFGRLTQADNVRFVACQTNLSFGIEGLARYDIRPDKLKLWCSFHPSQVTVEAFSRQCGRLRQEGISFSVGVVGDPEQLAVIRELRRAIPPEVYLWINDMDGRRGSYRAEEIAAFLEVDPLFGLELEKRKADTGKCRAGVESFFVDGKGDMFACNISRVLMGNLYAEPVTVSAGPRCRAKACSCYLAYSNRTDIAGLECFGDNRPFRIPVEGDWFGD